MEAGELATRDRMHQSGALILDKILSYKDGSSLTDACEWGELYHQATPGQEDTAGFRRCTDDARVSAM